MIRRRCVIEQHKVAEGRAQLMNFWNLHAGRDGTEGKIIKLDIPRNVAIHRGRQVFAGLPGQFPRGLFHLQDHFNLHDSEAEHR